MLILVLFLLGLCFGSFVNALVWRLHEQERKKSKKQKAELSIIHGRSMCPHCKHVLAPRDLVPVLSWLELRGKCRYCGKKYADTPVSELLVPTLFVLSYIYWPFTSWDAPTTALFGLWLVLIVGFVALILSDLRWYILPNRIVFPLQAVAVVMAVIQMIAFSDMYSPLGLVFGLLFSAGLFWVLHTISKGKWIGYGDVKLAVVIGLVLCRADLALIMLFTASLLGTLVAIPLMITGKAGRNTRLPFGPFLIAGTIVAYLFGPSLVHWYSTQFLFL